MASYDDLAHQFHSVMSRNPFNLVDREDFDRAHELPNITREAVQQDALDAISTANALDRELYNAGHSDANGFSFSEALDLEMAANELRAQAFQETVLTGGTPRHQVNPHALQDLLGSTPLCLERDPQPKSDIISSFTEKLEGIGPFLCDQVEKLDRPVGFMAEREIVTGKGFSDVASSLIAFAKSAESSAHLSPNHITDMEAALENASHLIDLYVIALEKMPKRTDYSIGPEATAAWFRYKGVALPLDEIHRIAADHMERTMEALTGMKDELARKYSLGDDASVHSIAEGLRKRHASPKGGVVALANLLYSRARNFANSSGLVVPLQDDLMEVKSCPDYLLASIPTAAVFSPGPFATGPKRATFYINGSSNVEESLNQLNLPAITAHELYPGHGYQLGRAREHPSLIRRWLRPMDLAEGWTTYVAEEAMTSTGFRGNPELAVEEEFMAKMDILRLGARVCFMLAGMTGDRRYLDDNELGITIGSPDLFSAAVEFYTKVTGFSHSRAYGDVRLFSSLDTYGALYLVGNHGFRKIEAAAQQKQGSAFSRPVLLERILKEGNLPLAYIERQLQHDGVL